MGAPRNIWRCPDDRGQQQCAPTTPICRSFASYFLIIAAICLTVGGANLVAGIGTLRGIVLARRLAWIVATVGAVAAAYLAITSINPSYYNEVDGTPVYNYNARLVAVTFVPYVAALVLLFIDRRVARRRAEAR